MGKGKREEKKVVCPLGLDTFHRAASLTFEKHFNSPLLLFPQGSHLILMTEEKLRPRLSRDYESLYFRVLFQALSGSLSGASLNQH